MYRYSYGYSYGTNWTALIIYLLILLGQCIAFGFITRAINRAKNRDGGFAWGFWLGGIGIIVCACRPRLPSWEETQAAANAEKAASAQQSQGGWDCVCGKHNSAAAAACWYCRRTRTEQEAKVGCPHCGALNRASNEFCFACGKPMKPVAADPADTVASAPDGDRTPGQD